MMPCGCGTGKAFQLSHCPLEALVGIWSNFADLVTSEHGCLEASQRSLSVSCVQVTLVHSEYTPCLLRSNHRSGRVFPSK